jgi:hypothetical protein
MKTRISLSYLLALVLVSQAGCVVCHDDKIHVCAGGKGYVRVLADSAEDAQR